LEPEWHIVCLTLANDQTSCNDLLDVQMNLANDPFLKSTPDLYRSFGLNLHQIENKFFYIALTTQRRFYATEVKVYDGRGARHSGIDGTFFGC
jgi:hypothetical protein